MGPVARGSTNRGKALSEEDAKWDWEWKYTATFTLEVAALNPNRMVEKGCGLVAGYPGAMYLKRVE